MNDQASEAPGIRAAWVERHSRTLALALLVVFAVQAISSSRVKNVTVDEITYITAGYYHLATGDFEYNMTNPIVMKVLAASPLLALDVTLPPVESDPSEWDGIEEWKYARRFLYDNSTDADTMLFVARLPILALGIALGAFVFLWASQLYGAAAGLLALFVYAFSPNVLAHTRLATQDLGLAAICFIASYVFWRHISQPKRRYLLAIGVVLGLAAGTKTTSVLLLPAWFLYWIVGVARDPQFGIDRRLPVVRQLAGGRPRMAQFLSAGISSLLVAGVALVTLNAVYGFSGSLLPLREIVPPEKVLARLPESPIVQSLADTLLGLPSPLPKPFLSSLQFQARLSASAGRMFFAGEIYEQGLWYLMGVSVLLKTPIPTILSGLVACWLALRGGFRRNGEWLLLAVPAMFLAMFSIASNVGGGVRYVLPMYPFVFVLIGRFARPEARWPKRKTATLTILGLWYLVGAFMIHPHYLAYFNETIGGPRNGYRYLADANVDWGQDLKLLKSYMADRDIDSIKLAYFGSADANYYGLSYEYLPSVGLAPKEPGQYWWYELDTDEKRHIDPQRGLIAVSANLISRPQWLGPVFKGTYDWLEGLEPIDNVGYSILIFDVK